MSDQTHGMVTMTRVIQPALAVQDLIAASLRDGFRVPVAAPPPD